MLAPRTSSTEQPIAVLGAGDLISHVQRGDDSDNPSNYRFNILRFGEDMRAMHDLRACDLRDLVKLVQVLAFSISDDGWLPREAHHALLALFEDLDELTQSWSEANDG
jgi:hypothetical protein